MRAMYTQHAGSATVLNIVHVRTPHSRSPRGYMHASELGRGRELSAYATAEYVVIHRAVRAVPMHIMLSLLVATAMMAGATDAYCPLCSHLFENQTACAAYYGSNICPGVGECTITFDTNAAIGLSGGDCTTSFDCMKCRVAAAKVCCEGMRTDTMQDALDCADMTNAQNNLARILRKMLGV
jgi:hypothetical protein